MKKQLPNLMTLANLFCGFVGILAAFNGDLALAGLLVFTGALFDVLDGMVARALHVSHPIGKELDSMADMVTFGLLPSIIAYMLLDQTHVAWLYYFYIGSVPLLTLIPFLIAAGAAWRLAKFNIDSSQSRTFRGLASPANGMFWASLPLILEYHVFVLRSDVYYLDPFVSNPYLIVAFIFLFSWLMVSDIPMFSFKFNSLKWRDNKIIFSFVLFSVLLFAIFWWAAVPVIILSYVILSYFLKANFVQADEVQSAD